MNKILKNIAIRWYRAIDATGLIYSVLQNINIYMRIMFYIAFPISLYFTLIYLGSIINLNKYYETNPLFSIILILISKLGLYLATTLSALLFSYEAILQLDIKAEIKLKKEDELRVKKDKLQWWRLRNMNRWVRIIIYIIVYVLILQYLQLSSYAAFNQSFTPVNEFLTQFYTLVKYFTGTFIIFVMVLDYFVNKNRNKIKQG